ncbi:hypothetical protein TNCV_3534941 [Trichonephila clavipes]|nr:hypothetical protein TNCV_3534941 [Trichonephila clavipes]
MLVKRRKESQRRRNDACVESKKREHQQTGVPDVIRVQIRMAGRRASIKVYPVVHNRRQIVKGEGRNGYSSTSLNENNIAPSDFRLFPALKVALSDRNFHDNAAVN